MNRPLDFSSQQISSTNVRVPVPLIDVHRQNSVLRDEILQALAEVIDSGAFVLGPRVTQLEQRIAEYCQVNHAVGCASGSDALLLALMACDVGPGDDVLLPSYTFFATASCVTRLGARPVFVDVDPHTLNIDVAKAAAALTPTTKAIIPVHLFGQCADMEEINKLAQQRGLFVIEDAAQAIGAEYQGRRSGSLGHIGCFSFYPTKNLGGMGDGGMLTTNDPKLADRLELLRGHGMRPRYYHQEIGINSRLDSMQAAVLDIKLNHLEQWTADRIENAQRYHHLFAAAGISDWLQLPKDAGTGRHVWNQYVVRIGGGLRDELRTALGEQEVRTEIYYPVPCHQQQCFRFLDKAELPITDQAAVDSLALPIFPELTTVEQQSVVAAVADFYRTKVAK